MGQGEEPPNGRKPLNKSLRQNLSEWLQTALLAVLTVAIFYVWAWAMWRVGSTVLGWIW